MWEGISGWGSSNVYGSQSGKASLSRHREPFRVVRMRMEMQKEPGDLEAWPFYPKDYRKQSRVLSRGMMLLVKRQIVVLDAWWMAVVGEQYGKAGEV